MHPTLPALDPGVTVLRRDSPRDTTLHRLVASELGDCRDAFWVDARNQASTYTLYEVASSRASLDALQIARAFTAYQHHSLVRDLVRETTPETDLLVLPCLPALYRDGDVPDDRAARLFESTLSVVTELATSLDARVLLTVSDDAATADDPLATRVCAAADHELECRTTREGFVIEGEDYTTPGYWHEGFWQTTVPYWADICGTVPRIDHPRRTVGGSPVPTPLVAETDAGSVVTKTDAGSVVTKTDAGPLVDGSGGVV